MKTLLSFLSLMFSANFVCNAQNLPEVPEGFKWEKVESLSDEFDYWDATKWHRSLWNYDVPVQMVAENSGVDNGLLWIKATLDDGKERWFKTSRVMSNTRISYPMYTECYMLENPV